MISLGQFTKGLWHILGGGMWARRNLFPNTSVVKTHLDIILGFPRICWILICDPSKFLNDWLKVKLLPVAYEFNSMVVLIGKTSMFDSFNLIVVETSSSKRTGIPSQNLSAILSILCLEFHEADMIAFVSSRSSSLPKDTDQEWAHLVGSVISAVFSFIPSLTAAPALLPLHFLVDMAVTMASTSMRVLD